MAWWECIYSRAVQGEAEPVLTLYRWWRSFFVSGACGGYVFLYSTYYFWTRLDVANIIGAMLYFGYMAAISAALSLLTGAVGVGASLWFTRKIYASIKVD